MKKCNTIDFLQPTNLFKKLCKSCTTISFVILLTQYLWDQLNYFTNVVIQLLGFN